MATDPLKIINQTAAALTSADSLRDNCAAALEIVAGGLSTNLLFIARASQDSGVADLVAYNGLHAADYRRLEDRLPKSPLWRILNANTPFVIDDLSQDVGLNFLAYGSRAERLLAVPIRSGAATSGLLAAAFDNAIDETRTFRLLETVASLLAHTIRVDQTIVIENDRLLSENRRLKTELKDRYDFGNLIGNSGGMRRALDQVRQIARSNAAVLLRGEPGTGKDTFANAIRYNSLRSKRPFVKLDLSVTPASQQVDELHGRLRAGEHGTVFLDEITAASLELQQVLLETMHNARLATRDEPAGYNVRIIAAASRDIEAQKTGGGFDDALYAELTSFAIYLPPLRERRSDVLLLADHFLERYAVSREKSILRISTPAIDMLTAYHFPGNVRELENVIEHAVTVCDSNVIHGHHLPPTLQTAEITGTETRVTLDAAVATFERDLIQDALKSTRGNVASAARMLDSTERILGYKIKKYELDPRRFKGWR
jgi:Nif-specific regulatory protein